MNEGRWILVHRQNGGLKMAVNLDHVVEVRQQQDGAMIHFSDGDAAFVRESFDEIGAMIR